MDINEFIKLCKLHDWDFRKTNVSDPVVQQIYKIHKEMEQQLITEVQRHPEWGELYLAFLHHCFDE